MDTHSGQVQLIGDDGRLLEHPTYKVDLSDEELVDLYRQLVVVRRIDQEGTVLQRQGHLGLWAPVHGQEAAQVGSARALQARDWVFPTYREMGVVFARGMDPIKPFETFAGLTHSGWDPQETHVALYSIPIATQVLHAVGYALGTKWDRDDVVAVAYFGDGATSEGELNEALNVAGVHRVPVVFFCQNNQWAISVPLRLQTAAPIYTRAPAFGFPGVLVDGNDVLAVYAVTRAAAEHAREGGGPTLIEAATYRLGAHTTSDDPTRYRSAEELAYWQEREPLGRYRAFLRRAGLHDDALEVAIQREAEVLVADLRARVLAFPDPPDADLVRHVYAQPPATLTAQWQALQAFRADMEAED